MCARRNLLAVIAAGGCLRWVAAVAVGCVFWFSPMAGLPMSVAASCAFWKPGRLNAVRELPAAELPACNLLPVAAGRFAKAAGLGCGCAKARGLPLTSSGGHGGSKISFRNS
jgi:hypothetical protein